MEIEVKVVQEFEECLDLSWKVRGCQDPKTIAKMTYTVELVLDHTTLESRQQNPSEALEPSKTAVVKRVPMGLDVQSCIQNMPEGRRFLVAVVGSSGSLVLRSPWIRAKTLSPATREKDQTNLDPMSQPRMNCNDCSCVEYVPLKWGLNTPDMLRCRRCGCHYSKHVVVEVSAILAIREEQAQKALKLPSVTPLPGIEALSWDTRECSMWFLSQGAVHPRRLHAEGRSLGEASGSRSKSTKGRVSVITPTTQSRQNFHSQLWSCFLAQDWPDKELVVVETYTDMPSTFFERKAKADTRLIYVKFQRLPNQDFSIGLKRNVAAQLATGEFLANFDDDDLYAPHYVSTMIEVLKERKLQALTLSSWYVYKVSTQKFSFCEPVAWGLTKGLDENDEAVRTWAYGYGFSYVFRRQASLDQPYENINFGEDYQFIRKLQRSRGDRSVGLYRDDFGICLHIQHGGNTSDSIPLREVSMKEAVLLDVMLLPGAVQATQAALQAENLGSTIDSTRHVTVHAADGTCTVTINKSCSVADFLVQWRSQQNISAEEPVEVLLVPPLDVAMLSHPDAAAASSHRDELAAEALGIAFLARLAKDKKHLTDETSKSGKQWRKLLAEAQGPMKPWQRLGPRVARLWVVPGNDTDKQDMAETEDVRTARMIVEVTCQQSTAKQFLRAASSCQVWLPVDATVAHLRKALGSALSQKAKIMEAKNGSNVKVLQDNEPVPMNVTVSEFAGQQTFFMYWQREDTQAALHFMIRWASQRKAQQRISKAWRDTRGNDALHRLALSRFYNEEIYPKLLTHWGLPDDDMVLRCAMSCMQGIEAHPDMAEDWLKLEMLMHNAQHVALAHGLLSEAGKDIPPLEEFMTKLRLIAQGRADSEGEKTPATGTGPSTSVESEKEVTANASQPGPADELDGALPEPGLSKSGLQESAQLAPSQAAESSERQGPEASKPQEANGKLEEPGKVQEVSKPQEVGKQGNSSSGTKASTGHESAQGAAAVTLVISHAMDEPTNRPTLHIQARDSDIIKEVLRLVAEALQLSSADTRAIRLVRRTKGTFTAYEKTTEIGRKRVLLLLGIEQEKFRERCLAWKERVFSEFVAAHKEASPPAERQALPAVEKESTAAQKGASPAEQTKASPAATKEASPVAKQRAAAAAKTEGEHSVFDFDKLEEAERKKVA